MVKLSSRYLGRPQAGKAFFAFLILNMVGGCQYCTDEEPAPIRQPPRQPPRVVRRADVVATPPPPLELETPTPTPKLQEEIPNDSVMAKALAYFKEHPEERLREQRIGKLVPTIQEDDLEVIRKALLTGEAERCRAAISLWVKYYVGKGELDKVDDAYQRFFNRCDPRAQDPRDWLAHARSLLMANLPQRALNQVNEAEKRAPDLPKGVDLVSFQTDILEVRARSYEGLFRGAVASFEEDAVSRNYWTQANQTWQAYKTLLQDSSDGQGSDSNRVAMAEEHLTWLNDQRL